MIEDPSLRSYYLKQLGFGTNLDGTTYNPSTGLISNPSAYTSISGTNKDYTWLNSGLSFLNTLATGIFGQSGTSSATTDTAAQALAAYQAKLQADQEAAKAKQMQTLLIGAVVVIALAVGAYFLLKKK